MTTKGFLPPSPLARDLYYAQAEVMAMQNRHAGSHRHVGAMARVFQRPAAAAAALVMVAAFFLAAAPALANHDEDAIFCDVHRGYYEAGHFRRHTDGYLVMAGGGYHFYPRPAYGALVGDYFGRPSVFVSSGYFYPLWVGYGPVYEPTGYFGIYGGRFGRTQMGLRIGINALPTVGFGFLGYRAPIVHYQARPQYYYRSHAGPPHLYYRGGQPHGKPHGKPHHPRHGGRKGD